MYMYVYNIYSSYNDIYNISIHLKPSNISDALHLVLYIRSCRFIVHKLTIVLNIICYYARLLSFALSATTF